MFVAFLANHTFYQSSEQFFNRLFSPPFDFSDGNYAPLLSATHIKMEPMATNSSTSNSENQAEQST